MSDKAPQVYAAIAKVQGALAKHGIVKDRKNQQQGYQFRGIDDCYNAIATLMAEHGLCILPRVIRRETADRQTKKGDGTLIYTVLTVEFDFVSSEDGSKHTVCTYGEAMDSGDKSTNKAMSAAMKYAILMTFTVPTEGDNDTENQTHELAPQRQMPDDRQRHEPAKRKPPVDAATPVSHQKSAKEVFTAHWNALMKRCDPDEKDSMGSALVSWASNGKYVDPTKLANADQTIFAEMNESIAACEKSGNDLITVVRAYTTSAF